MESIHIFRAVAEQQRRGSGTGELIRKGRHLLNKQVGWPSYWLT